MIDPTPRVDEAGDRDIRADDVERARLAYRRDAALGFVDLLDAKRVKQEPNT